MREVLIMCDPVLKKAQLDVCGGDRGFTYSESNSVLMAYVH